MTKTKIMLGRVPAIVWGERSDKAYIYVHGKKSCKEYAESFAEIAQSKGYQTLSFDLPEHGERAGAGPRCDVWSGMSDLSAVADYAFGEWKRLSLFACSVGAYFSLQAYAGRPFEKCLFVSPIVDMEQLVKNMFVWFNVTEERLKAEKEIETEFEPLRWDYYQYILSHPTDKWVVPTSILYGGKDNLQSIEAIRAFEAKFGCDLTVSPESEHPFMSEGDMKLLAKWLSEKV